MRNDRLNSIATLGVAYDTETHKIQPGLAAPPIVCASVASPGQVGALLTPAQGRDIFLTVLKDPRLVLVAQNAAFDVLVMAVDAGRRGLDLMPQIMQMYLDGRVFDIGIAEQLHAIANGHLLEDPRSGGKLRDPSTNDYGVGYRLSVLQDLVLDRQDAKSNDRFRLSYQLLEHLPHSEWPFEARTYPVDDAVNTLEIALAQLPRNRNLHEVGDQTFTDFCLKLASAQGFLVDPPTVYALETKTAEKRELHIQEFIDEDFFTRLAYKKRCKTCVGGSLLNVDEVCPACNGGAIKVSEKTGSESQNRKKIKRLLADAYQVTGVCSLCEGACEVPGLTGCKECKARGIVEGCEVPACVEGKVPHPKNKKGCPRCDTTGRDLETSAIPRTDGGGISYGRDSLSESGDELLIDFAEFGEADKIRSTYLPGLKEGIGPNDQQIPITLWCNILLATGRVSYSGIWQTLPRSGGVRECVVPKPGCYFLSADYKGLELVTHAQSCLNILGFSELAKVLNSGQDAHSKLGGEMSGIPYEEFLRRCKTEKLVGDYRQAAKPGNFGFPGGMGSPKMVMQQRKADFETKGASGKKYRGLRFCLLIGGAQECGEVKVVKWGRQIIPPTCKRCIECAETLRDTWFKTYPENRPYFKYIAELVAKRGELVQHGSNRIRGGIDFCSAANSFFQGLGADVAKLAVRRVTVEQYTKRDSDLFGSRLTLLAHDELFMEVRKEQASAAAKRLSEVMVGALQELCPDLAPAAEAEPALMERWYKDADPCYNEEGELIPWEPS